MGRTVEIVGGGSEAENGKEGTLTYCRIVNIPLKVGKERCICV